MFFLRCAVFILRMPVPPMVMLPLPSGRVYILSKSSMSVDLPEPVPPSTPSVVPAGMVKLTSCSTSELPS